MKRVFTIGIKRDSTFLGFMFVFFCLVAIHLNGQENVLLFGEVSGKDSMHTQERFLFHRYGDSLVILHSNYGYSPTQLNNVTVTSDTLYFDFPYQNKNYRCILAIDTMNAKTEYNGLCFSEPSGGISINIKEWSVIDYMFHGKYDEVDSTDLLILDRTIQLLDNGRSWNPHCNRICDNSDYPYKWSLFCALHQSALEITGQYKHMRPVNEAVRNVIVRNYGKKPGHILMNFNNDVKSYSEIRMVLEEARKDIQDMLQ